jgi:hypothetical protein
MSRDSSVGIAAGWTTQVRFPVGQDFSFLHSVQTGSGVHPISYPRDTWGDFPRVVKRKGLEADHSPPSNSKVKNDGVISPLPYTSSVLN